MPAKYLKVAHILFGRIDDGTYPVGQPIPSIEALATELKVNERTIRRGLSELEAKGLLVVRTGVGTIVRATSGAPVVMDARPGKGGVARTWAQQHPEDGEDVVVVAQWATADEEIASRLGLTEGDRVVHRVRHQYKGGQRAQIHEQWIPGVLADGIKAATGDDIADIDNVPTTDMFTLLRSAGHAPAWVTERNSARMPHDEEARALGLPETFAVLDVQRVTTDADGMPLETSAFCGSGDRMSTSYTVAL